MAMILKTDRVIDFFLQVDDLIRNQTTGTAAELGSKLSLKRQTVYRLMHQLKGMNLPIYYSYKRKTYFYLRQNKIHHSGKPIATRVESNEACEEHRFAMVAE